MRVLGLDSATLIAGIAVVEDDRVLAQGRHDASNRTADMLVTVDTTVRSAGITPRDIDAVAVGAGPGSFTGLRIGMATAKGIAFAAGKPLWAVSSLAALARDGTIHLADEQLFPYLDGVVVAVLDARRNEVFVGCYDAHTLALLGTECVFAPSKLAAHITAIAGERLVSFVGDALAVFPTELAPFADRWYSTTPSGASVAALALAGARVDIVVTGGPTYIRKAEAEVMYPDGIPGAMRKR